MIKPSRTWAPEIIEASQAEILAATIPGLPYLVLPKSDTVRPYDSHELLSCTSSCRPASRSFSSSLLTQPSLQLDVQIT